VNKLGQILNDGTMMLCENKLFRMKNFNLLCTFLSEQTIRKSSALTITEIAKFWLKASNKRTPALSN